jgi:hypothetical protein
MREYGRCAGCLLTGDLKRVDWHVLCCAAFARLYRKDRARALTPALEYARWRREEGADERAADLAGRVADTQSARAASVARFTVADPLED